jgi:antitoxin MazE
MKAQIIRIGNSQGIRIPKALLEESGIKGEVELVLADEGILIRAGKRPRASWDAIFAALAENDDDDAGMKVRTSFEAEEWQW